MVASENSHSGKSIRLFKNPLLERLTHVHPIMPLLVWVPVIVWMFWKASDAGSLSAGSIAVLGISGTVSWTLFEYLMHRFAFHFEGKNRVSKRLVFLFHGIHHDDPQDPTRLVMPPAASILLGWIFYHLFQLALGPTIIHPFFGGFIAGYLIYDYTHYAVHHFTPQTSVGRYLKQYHMLHHFVTPEARWGVTSPVWDVVFGTFARTETRKPSPSS